MQIDLSIIIVSWNVWDLLRASLQSVERASRPGKSAETRVFGPVSLGSAAPTLETIVVDNASADATAELLPARFPWVRLVRSATNLGFTAGNNVGYATSRGRAIYFLNPDTELVDGSAGDSLWTLYRALIDNPTLGLVGPQLRYGDNTLQESRRRFPTLFDAFLDQKTIGRYWHNNPWQRRLHMDDWPAGFCQEVDWVVGAAMLARRDALEQVRQSEAAGQFTGPFDESFFMYSEETDLCNRLRQEGWQIAYVPQAVVIHYEGQSSGQVAAARETHFHNSMIRYYQKYFGAGWATALRYFLLWNLRGQLLIESAKYILGHKRPLRAERIAAYRQVLATGLRPKG
jgi:GT2 family glycosyltransferase